MASEAIADPARFGGWGAVAAGSHVISAFGGAELYLSEDEAVKLVNDALNAVITPGVASFFGKNYLQTNLPHTSYGRINTSLISGSSLTANPRITELSLSGTIFNTVEPTTNARTGLSVEVARSLSSQKVALKSLTDDWDGYGAAPLKDALVSNLVGDLAMFLRGEDVLFPDIIPGADGSVQAEWHLPIGDIFYGYEGDGTRFLIVMPRGAEPLMIDDEEAIRAFEVATQLYLRRTNDNRSYFAGYQRALVAR